MERTIWNLTGENTYKISCDAMRKKGVKKLERLWDESRLRPSRHRIAHAVNAIKQDSSVICSFERTPAFPHAAGKSGEKSYLKNAR